MSFYTARVKLGHSAMSALRPDYPRKQPYAGHRWTSQKCQERPVAARSWPDSEQRIYLLSAWREAPCYTERERAALGWTEALTRLSEGHTHESAYGALKAQFSDEEQVKLTLMINIINGWNRLFF
jgi:hypothetical protein